MKADWSNKLFKGEKTIVLISGKMRSGKDTVANILLERLKSEKCKPRILHFSDGMKEILSKTLDISIDVLNDLKNNKNDLVLDAYTGASHTRVCQTNMRTILQRFGTDAMQSVFGKDIWTSLMHTKINTDTEHNVFIIPDFRFKHEYFKEPYKKWYTTDYTNFVTIRVENPETVMFDDFQAEINTENTSNHISEHISERDLDEFKFDITLINPHTHAGVSDAVYSDCACIANEILKLY